MITTALGLHCQNCHTEILIDNERPAWLQDEEIEEQLAQARAFCRSVQTMAVTPRESDVPAYVIKDGDNFRVAPIDPRYIHCPNCDDKVHLGEDTLLCWLHGELCVGEDA